MNSEKRDVLTQQKVNKDLKYKEKRETVKYLHALMCWELIFGLVALLLGNVGLTLAAWIVFAVPFLPVLWRLVQMALIMKKIEAGRFSVFKDELERLGDHEFYFHYYTWIVPTTFLQILVPHDRLFADFLHFRRYGRYQLTPADRSAFRYSSAGDEFYVVVYDGKPELPVMVYNAKVYSTKS